MMQLGTAACPSPPSRRLIFHATDAKSRQNIWPGVRPPFGVGSRWRYSIAASARLPLPTRVRGSPQCPLLHSHPWGCWQLKEVPSGSRLWGGRRGRARSSSSCRGGFSSGLGARDGWSKKSHWAIPPRCRLPLCWCRNPLQGWSYRYVPQPGSYPRWQPVPRLGAKSTVLHEP